MRAILLFALAGGLLFGCRTPDSKAPGGEDASAARDRRGSATAVTPVSEPTGKVASVNQAARFVVIDFAFNPVPRVDQRMSVYRQGQKVGEIKISRQSRNNIVAADITAGEARIGDEVRPD